MQGIYQIVHTVTAKRYIGSSIDIEQRWLTHRWALEHGYHGNRHLQRAWDKYGAESFRFDVYEQFVGDETLLRIREEEVIATIPRIERYNICEKANCGPSMKGWIHTEQARANMAASQIGRKHTTETIEKMRAAWRPRDTPESRARMAEKLRGRKRLITEEARANIATTNRRNWLGRSHSEETKAKISETKTGSKLSLKARQKMSDTRRGVPKSAEHRARIGAAIREAHRRKAEGLF